jgi:hypothetical protein
LRLVAAGAPKSRASSGVCILVCRRCTGFTPVSGRHDTTPTFVSGTTAACWFTFRYLAGRSGGNAKSRCIVQEKHVLADKELDGRKKTSSNQNIRE